MTFEDHHAITKLINRYAECSDSGDFDGIGELYANCVLYLPDQTIDVKEIGVERYMEYYNGLIRKYGSGTPRCRHIMATISIDDDGPDRARSQCYVIVVQATEKLPLQVIIAGTLHDKFAKQNGEWVLVERREDLELVGDMSHHLLIPMPTDTFDPLRA